MSSHLDGRYHGMTVSSFTSISLDPPLVLVSIKHDARTHAMVSSSGVFAVSILGQEQQEISDVFAGRVDDDQDRFQDVPYYLSQSGCPVPEGILAYLDCRVQSTISGGTHSIFVGEVLEAKVMREGKPLVYYDQDYRDLGN